MPRLASIARLIGLAAAVLVSFGLAAPASAGTGEPLLIGEHLQDVVLETPHPYPPGDDQKPGPVWRDHFRHPGARYLVFEFEKLDLAPGDRVEIRSAVADEVLVYRGKGVQNRGGSFITKIIPGDEATIELYSKNRKHGRYGYRIGRVTRGYNEAELTELYGAAGIEAVCGVADMEDAVCYETAYPGVYESSRPVALILMDGVEMCSAWLVSCESHLMTASHCTWDGGDFDSQAELDRMEFLFMYQEPTCGGASPVFEYSFMGGTWLENDHDLDYTLIQAPAGEDPAAAYGWLLIDYRLADVDELIYIVGHPSGGPKGISLFSTHPEDQDNLDGFCEIFSRNESVCVGGTVPEIGYHCDTEGGGYSGSPVLSRNTNKVVALHHCAGCPNRGVRIESIWDHNQSGSSPLPACSLFEDAGVVSLDAAVYLCSASVVLQVVDGSLRGAGSQAVSVWSATEPVPEQVTLVETGTGTGVFIGAIDLVEGSPSLGDGLLSVLNGDTITVRYVDAYDGQGGTNVPRLETASIDCVGPAISSLEVLDVLGIGATVRWVTDEAAQSVVFYQASGPGWSTATAEGLTTTHEIGLQGLTPCTDYTFWVQSTDLAGNQTDEDNAGSYHAFATGVDVQPLYFEDHAVNIRDLKNAVSTINVADSETVMDVDVTVNITHLYAADVEIYLMGPNGLEIDLSSDNGGADDNYVDTRFDDEAAASILEGAAPFTGSFRPEQPLAAFDGISAAGDWSLRVFDDNAGDAGTLDSWSLQFLYPARPCGPQASYAGHLLSADSCAPGQPGDSDGIWDAGEEVSFVVTLENSGTDPSTGLSATVMSLTPGIVVTDGTALFPDLSAGASASSLSSFTAMAPAMQVCGDRADFRIDVTGNEGTWTDTFQQVIGLPLPGGGSVLQESFDAGIPGTWTVVDGGTSSDTWYADTTEDPLGCTSTDPATPIAGSWAALDSDCAGAVDMDEELITPVMELSFATTAMVEFDHYYNRYETEVAALDIRSSLTGGSWLNLQTWNADTANPQHESIDITSQAAGAGDVEMRWHYHGANFDWYWYLDNVQVTYTSPAACDMNLCTAAGPPPGEQTGAHWADGNTFTWDMDPGATGGYILYRGTGPDLPALMETTPDSCTRFTGIGPLDRTVDLSADDPSGGFYWYFVTGWSDGGEGSAGSATDGPRVLSSVGPCPP